MTSPETGPHPLRIQRTRTKGARLPNDVVCVTRPGKWGNPFDTAPEFRSWLAGGTDPDAELEQRRTWILNHVQELRGKQLACWCSMLTECHADVLAELASSNH
jgi:hypothetical protein